MAKRISVDVKGDMDFLKRLVAAGDRKVARPHHSIAEQLIVEEIQKRTHGRLIYAEEVFPVRVCVSNESSIRVDGQRISTHLLDYTGAKGQSVSGELVDLKDGAESDFSRINVNNKIIACRYNVLNHRFYQIRRALLHGAAGIIVISQHDKLYQIGIGSPEYMESCPIPAVSIKREDWNHLAKYVGKSVSIDYQFQIEKRIGKNLIFDHISNDSQKTAVIGAHYDSWFGGAQDNGVAVAMLVGIAGAIVSENIEKNVRFIFFDGEELGMLGSSWHVGHADTDRYSAYINLEMPIPCKGTKLKTLFYSGSLWHKGVIPFIELATNFILPLPLEFYYWLTKSPVFPADIDGFHKKKIPSISTYCSNPFHHTSEDTCEKINWKTYGSVMSLMLRIIGKV